MPQASTATMNHNTDLTFEVNAHFRGRELVINLVHHLDFTIMIA